MVGRATGFFGEGAGVGSSSFSDFPSFASLLLVRTRFVLAAGVSGGVKDSLSSVSMSSSPALDTPGGALRLFGDELGDVEGDELRELDTVEEGEITGDGSSDREGVEEMDGETGASGGVATAR